MTPRLWPTWYSPFTSVAKCAPTLKSISDATADRFHINRLDMKTKRRTHKITHPRQLAMLVASRLTCQSYSAIGRAFGNLDHTTVIYGVEQAQKRVESDPVWAGHFECIKVMVS